MGVRIGYHSVEKPFSTHMKLSMQYSLYQTEILIGNTRDFLFSHSMSIGKIASTKLYHISIQHHQTKSLVSSFMLLIDISTVA